MNSLTLENRVQNLLSSTCGFFQLYFYKNLFDPDERSKVLDHQKLTENTLETIINEIFSTDVNENEYLLKISKKSITYNLLFLLEKESVKMNNLSFIPSHGLREIYLEPRNMHWYMCDSSFYDRKKEIPFFKLILDMKSLCMRYYMHISLRPFENIWHHILISDFNKLTSSLILSFEKIKSLSEELFYTGDIETNSYCIEVYHDFVNNIPRDFFISESSEIKWILNY